MATSSEKLMSETMSTDLGPPPTNPTHTTEDLRQHHKDTAGRDVIRFRDCWKFHGRKGVLRNLNLVVKEGEIYGLLGASGCGKTTTLSCIVGLDKIDGGTISVLGSKPHTRGVGISGKRIGYMPQELALYMVFTIAESMTYFGRIYGMSKSEIEKKKLFLIEFLQLPEEQRLVANLSGGQRRRTSFALSLMHDPELLILDEPTVGVDPILRRSIWSFMRKLTADGGADMVANGTTGSNHARKTFRTTILITTHYIEEARMASVVGMMSKGRLIAESCPDALVSKYGVLTLEDVFVKLIVRQNLENETEEDSRPPSNSKKWMGSNPFGILSVSRKFWEMGFNNKVGVSDDTRRDSSKDSAILPISYSKKNVEDALPVTFSRHKDHKKCSFSLTSSLYRILALVTKSGIKIMRNPSLILFTFLLPAVQIILFCLGIGRNPTSLPIGVVNHEVEGTSCDFEAGCTFLNMSCRLLNSFSSQESLQLLNFDKESEALDAIKAGKVWGSLTIPQNFSRTFVERFLLSKTGEEIVNQSSTYVKLDMSNDQISLTVTRALLEGFQNFTTTFLEVCDRDASEVTIPLIFQDPVYGKADLAFTDFAAPGLMVLSIFALSLSLTSQSFIEEKRDGLLSRSGVAGVLPSELILSHVLSQLLVICIQVCIILFIALYGFNISNEGPVGLLLLFMFLQGLTGMCFGFLLSSLFDSESAAIQVSIGLLYPMMLLGGVFWPLEGMPVALMKISLFLPSTQAVESVRSIMTRGWGIEFETVYLGIVSTVSWMVICLVSSYVSVKHRKW